MGSKIKPVKMNEGKRALDLSLLGKKTGRLTMLNDKSALECVNRANNNMTSAEQERGNLPPPATAAEATGSMMSKRGPSFVMGSPRNYPP